MATIRLVASTTSAPTGTIESFSHKYLCRYLELVTRNSSLIHIHDLAAMIERGRHHAILRNIRRELALRICHNTTDI